jgi:hypothetical protein
MLPLYLCLLLPRGPTAADLSRFPPLRVCEHQAAWLDGRLRWLEGQRALFAAPAYCEWFEAAEQDARARRAPWETLARAHRLALPPVTMRDRVGVRLLLADLRGLLSEDDFSAGVLPPVLDVTGPFCRRGE